MSGRRFEPALWALLSCCLYLFLRADAFYKTDGIDIVRLFESHADHPWHVGYLPLLGGFRWLLSGVGLSPDYLQLGGWFSACCAAFGVGLAHAGMRRLGMATATARFATALFALSPGLLTFATIVEFHGPMLLPLGLAFWWMTVQVKSPSWWGMVLLAGFCHMAFLVHSQQLFLPVWLLALFVALRGRDGASRAKRDLTLAGLCGLVHGALVLGLPRVMPAAYGFWSDLGMGLRTESSIGRPQSLDFAPEIFWQEWLWPLLPVSLIAFTAPLQRTLRREFIAFAIGFLPYLYLSVRQLVFEPEYGAYMLPMVLPAAMLAAQRLGTRWWVWLLLPVGVVQWYRGPAEHVRNQSAIDQVFAERIAAAAGSASPFVMVGSHRELGSAYARLDKERILWVRPNATLPRAQATPGHFAGVEAYLNSRNGSGDAVLLTASALGSLEDPHAAMLAEKATLDVPENDELAGPLFAEHLRARFRFEPAADGVWRLLPR